MSKIQLTSQEIENLKNIAGKHNNLLMKFGQLHLRTTLLNQQLQRIKTEDSTLMLEQQQIKKQQIQIGKYFNQKYGDGSIDTTDWTFSPKQTN